MSSSNCTPSATGEFHQIPGDERNVVQIVNEIPNSVHIASEGSNTVEIDEIPPNTVIVTVPGLTTGVVFTQRYVHNQPVASASWVITHPLGGRPSVTIVDSSATVVIGEVVYNTDEQLTVNFSAPFSGFAYLT